VFFFKKLRSKILNQLNMKKKMHDVAGLWHACALSWVNLWNFFLKKLYEEKLLQFTMFSRKKLRSKILNQLNMKKTNARCCGLSGLWHACALSWVNLWKKNLKNYMKKNCYNSQCFQGKNYKAKFLTSLILKK